MNNVALWVRQAKIFDVLSFVLAVLATVLSTLLFAGFAFADLPPQVATSFTAITNDFNALLVLAWPLIALIVSSFWIIKAFKRIVFSA